MQKKSYREKAEDLIAKGFDTKQAQKDALDYINRAYEQLREVAYREIIDVANAAYPGGSNERYAFFDRYDFPYSLHQVREKHFAMFADTKASVDELKELIAMREAVKAMPVVKKETKAEAKARAIAEMAVQDKTGATRNIIAELVEPLKQDAIKLAVQNMEHRIARLIEGLAEKGMDLNVFAPEARGNMSRDEYKTASAKRAIMSRVTKRVAKNHLYIRPSEPLIVEKDQDGIERVLKDVADMAAIQYDEFVGKLVLKIGKCDSATLEGNHVWNASIIRAVKGDTVENWKTQTIVNFSKYGLAFLQYPTRKVK